MGTSDLFRNLEWQIETHLAKKAIENIRKGWDWEKTPEENLTVAVTDVVPFIFECHGRWCDEILRREQDQTANREMVDQMLKALQQRRRLGGEKKNESSTL